MRTCLCLLYLGSSHRLITHFWKSLSSIMPKGTTAVAVTSNPGILSMSLYPLYTQPPYWIRHTFGMTGWLVSSMNLASLRGNVWPVLVRNLFTELTETKQDNMSEESGHVLNCLLLWRWWHIRARLSNTTELATACVFYNEEKKTSLLLKCTVCFYLPAILLTVTFNFN